MAVRGIVAGLALALRSARSVVSHRLLIGRRGHLGGLDKLVPGNPVGCKDVACRVAGPPDAQLIYCKKARPEFAH